MLEHVKFPWPKLEKILNDIIDQINKQAPVKGDGVILNRGDSGTVISLETDDSGADDQSSTPSS